MHPRKRLAFKNKARAARQTKEAIVSPPVTKAAPKVVVTETSVTPEPIKTPTKKVVTPILPTKKKKSTSSGKTSS